MAAVLANDKDDSATEIFVYTGIGEFFPYDVVRARIDPSVLAIPMYAFIERRQLQKVELHEGIREIGRQAFDNCTALKEVQSSDGVERIGNSAFRGCNFAKFRCPPLVTTISQWMLRSCTRMFSLEVSETIIQVVENALGDCHSLRNVALASNTAVEWCAFSHCSDLLHIFGTEEAMVNALRNRFAGLPIHGKMYYISYYPVDLEEFRNIIMSENGELDPTGFQQDRLGMTPLHILACSTVQCLELYQLMVDKYSANLIVEDAWGAKPLLYAVWVDAPNEIVNFLLNSYQSFYPDHVFEWSTMVITLGRRDAPTTGIQNLLDIQSTLSPEYNIDWDQVFGVLAVETELEYHMSPKTFCFLTRCSIATRVNVIGVKHFRDTMADNWLCEYNDCSFNRQEWHTETLTKLEYYESEYRKLKESTSLLELALWKMRMDNSILEQGDAIGRGNKKMKFDQSDFRLQCRVSCGADHVVENVWPYLLPNDYVRAYVYSTDEEDDDNSDSDNE